MSRTIRYVVLLVALLVAALAPVTGVAQARVSPAATARPAFPRSAPVRTLSVAAPSSSPSRPALGRSFAISGRMPGRFRRPVVLVVDGTRRASERTDRAGRYRFILRAPSHVTTLRVKVRAPRVRRHRAALTAIRLVPVVIPVQSCATLPAGRTIWLAGSRRRLDCRLTVPVGSTLRIGPGASVLFGGGAGIVVKGSLVVAGTADAPVRLTPATSSRWAGISMAGDGSADITHAVITDAQTAVDDESSAADPKGHVRVSHSRIRRCGAGVIVQSSVSTVWTLHAAITDSEFARVDRGVWIQDAFDPLVTANSFHGVSGVPVTVESSGLDLDLIHDNAGYDNAENVWVVGGDRVMADGTLVGGRADQAPGTSAAPRPLMPLLEQGGFTTDPGTTIAIASGVVKADSNSAITVLGQLSISGIAGNPVVLTAAQDGTVGDPATASGGASSGGWYGIWVSGPGGRRSVDARYLDLRDAFIGIQSLAGGGGSVTVLDSSFTKVGDAVWTRGAVVRIERSTFADVMDGVSVEGADHPVVRDDSFSGVTNLPVRITGSTLDVDDLSGNVVTSSIHPFMEVGAVTVDADGAWPMGPGAWNPGAAPPAAGESVPLTVLVDSATIASGATVTFGPGAAKLDGSLDVAGSAVLQGTDAQPVVFTSVGDDHVGVPISSGYYGDATDLVAVQAGGSVSATNAVFRNSATAVSLASGATASLSHVEFAGTTKAVDAPSGCACPGPFGTTSVTGSDVWFGATGGPGGLSALATSTDQLSSNPTPDEIAQHDAAKAAYDDAVGRYGGSDPQVSDNSIPFATWAAYQFSFPVTPVLVDLAPAAPFPDFVQG